MVIPTPANDNVRIVFDEDQLFITSIYLWHKVALHRMDIPTWCWNVFPMLMHWEYSEDTALDLLVNSYEFFGKMPSPQKVFLRELWQQSRPAFAR